MATGARTARSEFESGRDFELRGRWAHALDAYGRSIELGENTLASYERLAELYAHLRYLGRSCRYAARAATARGFDATSLSNLARAQFRAGRLAASLRTYRLAMKRSPDDAALHSRYLFALLHDERQTAATLKEANEGWFSTHFAEAASQTVFANTRDPERKLRLGYVCGEFAGPLQRHFLLPVIKNHDREQFSVYCYHTAETSDSLTEEFKRHADCWRDAGGKSPNQIKEQIVEDEIDVLVERSGHIAPQQSLGAFHLRAAPVQAAYLNYPCTTGCREIDHLISDCWTTPDDAFAQQYSERAVYRVPSGCLLYAPLLPAPVVTSLPASRKGYVTFGLFQRPVKYNEHLWDAIGVTMNGMANARLLIHHADNELEESGGETRGRILAALYRRGVAAERIDFLGFCDARDHLRVVAAVDIAFDSFPYSGETTTCGCLWMGVPVVTMAGSIHASRISAAILSRLGLEDWVAASVDEYAQIAALKASNLTGLAELRASLRDRMLQSSVCRPDIVVRELEEGYRWMWRKWCSCS